MKEILMIKRIYILLALSLSTVSVATIPSQKKDVIFLWDLHHVLLKPKGRIRALKHYPHKKKALRNTNLRRKFLKYSLVSRFKEVSSEKFLELGDRYNNPYFKEMILTASLAQEPMEKTVDILEELKEKGYTHHVGSNMGITTFNTITDAQKYPQFVPLFKNFDLDKSHVVTRKTDQFKKPNPKYFEHYLEKNNLDPETTRIIFIDDRRKNIQAANSVGLEGVRFKNATQLRRDLADMGIDISR
ncbi:hypothetical protein E3J61_02985 [Candidatus Dependentiae bacterium]|nr:MAG: hypothetical protein E3J61_02985 [Candidatus Dependentiae bacterium]